MRRLFIIPVLLFLLATAAAQTKAPARKSRPAARAGASTQPSVAKDEQAINDLQRRDIDAHIALDIEKMLALSTDDVVYMVPGRAPLRGQSEVRKYLEDARKQIGDADIVGYEAAWQEVQVSGNVAYQWGSTTIRIKPSTASDETRVVQNVMRILKRDEGGDWKISRVIWNSAVPPQPASAPTPH